MGTIDDMKSALTQSALDALCEKFHIPRIVHPELPRRNHRIRNSPTGKIPVHIRFFDFANYRIPLSQFFVDILEYFQINLSQFSVFAAAKVSHFEILCSVHGFVLTIGNSCRDVFVSFIKHADPTKVQIGERKVREGEVSLLELTRGCVVPLSGVNDQGDANIQDDEVPATVAEKAKESRKKRKATGGKFFDVLQSLLEGSTLAVEVGVTVAETVPFVTSSVTLTLEREGGELTDSIIGPNLWTQRSADRFMISSDSSHHSSTNAADVEVSSVVRSPVSDPPIMTTAIATTVVVDTYFVSVPSAGYEPAYHTIFEDSTSIGEANPDITAARQTCLSSEARLWLEHDLRDMKKLEEKCRRQADFLKERDTEIASLKSQLSLKEAESMEAIHLCGQISVVEATESTRVNELKSLWERNLALEEENIILDGKVTALASAAAAKDNEFASLTTQPWREIGCHEMSGCTIDKGMQDGLVAGIDHGKARKDLVDVADYNPSTKANYVFAVNAFRVVDFSLFAQQESQKDTSIADVMGLLHLKVLRPILRRLTNCNPLLSSLCFLFIVHRTKWLLERLLVIDLVLLTCVIFEHFIKIIIHSTSLNHPCCGTLLSCLFAVIDNEFEEWAWSCELTSFLASSCNRRDSCKF
nr:putative transposase (putative), gypsy type [Tanacetum cinerariifolium]